MGKTSLILLLGCVLTLTACDNKTNKFQIGQRVNQGQIIDTYCDATSCQYQIRLPNLKKEWFEEVELEAK